jgi:sugar phosphate isomerase/epimerase
VAHELSLAAGNVQEFAPPEQVRAAAAAGFDAAGLWVEPDTWTAATTRDVRARLAESGLRALDVEVAWIRPGPPDPALERIIEIGGLVGARFVLIVSSDPDRAATKRRFAELCQRAADAGLVAVLEFLPITEIRTLADALDVVRDVAHPSSGILVDALHLARTGGKPDDLRALEPALLPYAQPADAPLAPPGTDRGSLLREALDGRLLPGEGALPLREWLDALPADVPLSPEIRSRALRERYPDIVERARVIAAATRRWLES